MAQQIGQIAGMSTEIISSFVIIVCSLMVYFSTNELYQLSRHKGIKYFRQAFLFFAIAYFFRSFIKFILLFFDRQIIFDIPIFLVGFLSVLIFIYFSSMAVFSLGYSILWKKWKNKLNNIYLFHVLALIISLFVVFSRNPLNYLIVNLILLAFIVFVVYSSYKSSKNKGLNLHIIYLLLAIFWIINILDILIPNIFKRFQLLISLASIGIFLTILYKVIRKTN